MTVRGKQVTVTCDYCTKLFLARVADRNRGWARTCSKSCAAKKREGSKTAKESNKPKARRIREVKTHRCRDCGVEVDNGERYCTHCEVMNEPDMSWDGHKH